MAAAPVSAICSQHLQTDICRNVLNDPYTVKRKEHPPTQKKRNLPNPAGWHRLCNNQAVCCGVCSGLSLSSLHSHVAYSWKLEQIPQVVHLSASAALWENYGEGKFKLPHRNGYKQQGVQVEASEARQKQEATHSHRCKLRLEASLKPMNVFFFHLACMTLKRYINSKW